MVSRLSLLFWPAEHDLAANVADHNYQNYNIFCIVGADITTVADNLAYGMVIVTMPVGLLADIE